MKKKVLAISTFPAPYRIKVFECMSKAYDIDLFFGAGTNESRHADFFGKSGAFHFEVLGTPEADSRYAAALKNIRSYDFVLAYDFNQTCAFKAILLCKLYRIPYFVNCDGAILKKNPVKDAVKHFFLSKAAGGFSSGKSATEYLHYYGIPKEKIHEHCFTSLNEEDILPEVVKDKAVRKEKLGLQPKKTVLTVGQFIPRKGFDVLLKAWPPLDGDYQLLIIGGGDDRAQYEQFIQEHNLHNVIIKDFVPKALLAEYYRAADLFVLPTREDIWGLVINEAMANGLPVITTDHCVAGLELIQPGVNGYLVPVENTELLTKYISQILSDDALCNAMAEQNVTAMQGCTLSRIAEKHVEAIEKILG